jgi:hypothetical protein
MVDMQYVYVAISCLLQNDSFAPSAPFSQIQSLLCACVALFLQVHVGRLGWGVHGAHVVTGQKGHSELKIAHHKATTLETAIQLTRGGVTNQRWSEWPVDKRMVRPQRGRGCGILSACQKKIV